MLKKSKLITSILILSLIITIPIISSGIQVSAITPTSIAGRINVSSTSLNVRSSPSTSSTILTALAKGSYVTLLSKSGDWWYVEYADGKYGYCSAAYITPLYDSYAAYVATESSNLNVRDGAGTGFEIKDKLPKGANVIILGKVNDWYWILYDGTNTGYCSAAFIKAHAKEQYPFVSLDTANFKQTDTRWANMKLGTSNTTFSKSGCLVCCVAIIETYRKGYTILPNTVANTLSFTSDGSMYWPSYFIFHNSSTNYMSILYNNLKSGKPVILGMKNSSGAQHWVVVTAYSGGNSLVASNFTIRDPGSNSRVNLQQLISSYPIFHRIAYY